MAPDGESGSLAGGRGLPIGNLTSQFFANVMLDPFDHFMTEVVRPGGISFRVLAEAVAAVERELIEGLPKMRRAGRTDVSDLKGLCERSTPVSEPLYAVA